MTPAIRAGAGAVLAAIALVGCGSEGGPAASAAPTSPIERIAQGAGVQTIGPAECVVAHSCALVIVHAASAGGEAAADETLTAAVRPTLRELLKERPDTTHVQVTVLDGPDQATAETTLRITCEGPSLSQTDWDAQSAASLRKRCDVAVF